MSGAYTGRSLFDSLSAPAPSGGSTAAPSEPGVLVVLRSGARVFLPRPKDAEEKWEERLIYCLTGRERPPFGTFFGGRKFLDSNEVAYAEITTSSEADKAAHDAKRAAEEAKAAAEKATIAAAEANAAADEVLGSDDADVADWTDEQIMDAVESMRHKIATKHFVEGEDALSVNMEIARLSGVVASRKAARQQAQAQAQATPPTGFGVVMPPPGAAS